jgi:chorismate mutase
MKNRKRRYFLLLIVAIAMLAAGAWALVRFTLNRQANGEAASAAAPGVTDPDLWAHGIEKVKADRFGVGDVAIEIPPELRHYDERRWFLATQVAEVKKHNLQPVQDFIDLAAMIQRGEMVSLPAATETYLLYGVGARVDGSAFTRYVANENLDLNDEAGLRAANARLEAARATLQKDISNLESQLSSQKDGAVKKQDELVNELTARQQELKQIARDKATLNNYYASNAGLAQGQSPLFRDYDALQTLAKNFGGRSFNLDDPNDRETLKVYLLSSARPPALKVLEEIATAYHDKFDRPLPVSSLIRPEQYQRALRRVNRYAVLIDTPPHSTGLAFDIDYRFMSGAEQNFVMAELARLKQAGRIEVLRERGANYHVFAFIDGVRPDDNLITASLDEAGAPPKQTTTEEPPLQKTLARPAPKRPAQKSRLTQKGRPEQKKSPRSRR